MAIEMAPNLLLFEGIEVDIAGRKLIMQSGLDLDRIKGPDQARQKEEPTVQLSAEVRWFWLDAAASLSSWFHSSTYHPCAPGGGGTRVDQYLCEPGQTELGVKSRGGKSGLEIKGLVSSEAIGLEYEPFVGSIEIWSKWTSKSLTLGEHAILEIKKQRWLGKFDTTNGPPREIPLDESEATLGVLSYRDSAVTWN